MKNKIIQWLDRNQYRPQNIYQLAKAMGIAEGKERALFSKSLLDLEADFVVIKSKKGEYGLAAKMGYVKGTLDLKAQGYGFLMVEGQENDIYIPQNRTLDAFHHDLCLAKISNYRSHTRIEGEIVKVLKRNLENVVGEYYQGGIFPKNEMDKVFFKVINKPKGMVDHTLVKAKIVKYSKGNVLDCEIVEVYGHKDDPGMEIIEVIRRMDIPYEFPEALILASQAIPNEVLASEVSGRRDLRKQLIFTIDGDDTKDIDDAISIEKTIQGNYILGVHIADVSHYVIEDSLFDQEALHRGTSVYLADRVIPMLPRALSNGICSLNPKVDRLAISCQMEINPQAEVVSYDIFPSVIHSYQQLTYSETNKVLAGETSNFITDHNLILSLRTMEELAAILGRVRTEIGSINFETIEPKIMLDEKGNVDDIVIRERGVSEKIIEEFMLVANQVVATKISRMKLPFLYRIHEKPDAEKLINLFMLAKELKYVNQLPKKITHKHLQKLLMDVEGSLYEKVINTLMLRSMAKAKYSESNVGHYGLAFPMYTHFTSPIRRYPDLMVHRMVREYLFLEKIDLMRDHFESVLPEIAMQSSKTERQAMIAEREVEDMKKAQFMEKRIGEEFEAVISTLTRFGMFVELPNTVEGLVHISTFPEAIEFNEEQMFYLGISSRTMYTIGKKVRVKLVKVNKALGKIDFILV